ncbi:hypothetical protein DL764_000328 [Monosporascus ibericus]|uniref:Uncharacterized protein n=1 Tax=Monosporascus ibericus TaxID=155417 RepID=A0A4Q4TVI0_9PEZI|nr:hypothetical protein DL764_000328 [Monosporascus ibericus]
MSSGKITDARKEELRNLQDGYEEMEEKKKEEQETLEKKKKELEELQEQLTELADRITTEEERLVSAASRSSQKARGKELGLGLAIGAVDAVAPIRLPQDVGAPIVREPVLSYVRTGHGDFAWYHRKLKHDDAKLNCSCGSEKDPEHLPRCGFPPGVKYYNNNNNNNPISDTAHTSRWMYDSAKMADKVEDAKATAYNGSNKRNTIQERQAMYRMLDRKNFEGIADVEIDKFLVKSGTVPPWAMDDDDPMKPESRL